MTFAVRIGPLVPECSHSCSKIHQRKRHFRSMPKTFAIATKQNQNFQSLTGLKDLARSHQYKGLDLQIVEHLEAADFILAHGTEAIGLANDCGVKPMKLDELEEILEHAVEKRIPMIIANPDHVTVEARALRVMPGTLGSKYEKMGGQVRWMGKPDQVIYEAAKEMTGVDAAECIAVGDSLHHDILGANNSGMQSVFVAGGIHANELGISQFGMVPEMAALQALTHSYGAYPSYIIPSFTW